MSVAFSRAPLRACPQSFCPDHLLSIFRLKADCLESTGQLSCSKHCGPVKHQELLARAKEIGCFAWPLREELVEKLSLKQRATLAEWYRVGAGGMALTMVIVADRGLKKFRQRVLELVAESLSALMVSLDEVGIREADVNAAHGLLRHWTKCERVFLSRYMSKDEPADPNGFRDAGDRLSYLESCVQVAQRRESQRGELIDEAQDIVRSVLSPEVSDVAPVLERLEFVVAALVGLGVGPRDAKLRKVVKPLCEHDLPEYIGDLLKAALEAARTRAATDTIGADTALKRKWSDKVNEVRLIFNGKRVILVGGEPRAEATAKMADAFQCTVQHETPAAHSSLDYLEDAIRHRDTAVVLLLIKLSSKGYGPQLQQLCRRAGIPLVRLKAGYGVERIAAEVLAQAGKRLSAKKV